jgi:polyferredoxin
MCYAARRLKGLIGVFLAMALMWSFIFSLVQLEDLVKSVFSKDAGVISMLRWAIMILVGYGHAVFRTDPPFYYIQFWD